MKLSYTAFLIAALAAFAAPCLAQTSTASSASASASTTSPVPAAKKAVKKKPAPKPAHKAAAEPQDEEVQEPSITGTTVKEYQCELGNKLTVFENNDDANHIALKWGKRVHRMTRVATSTGAVRFENRYYGLVWIGIPAKGILLDSKNGHELANECKTAEQLAQ
jgi:hypothetical protein